MIATPMDFMNAVNAGLSTRACSMADRPAKASEGAFGHGGAAPMLTSVRAHHQLADWKVGGTADRNVGATMGNVARRSAGFRACRTAGFPARRRMTSLWRGQCPDLLDCALARAGSVVVA